MNNLSDFANFGELNFFWRVGGHTEVCAKGAKNPRYASAHSVRLFVTTNIKLKRVEQMNGSRMKDIWNE